MPSASTMARSVYDHGCRVLHPVIDSFVPVTYTGIECRERIRRLDPTGARSESRSNHHTDARIIELGAKLGVDEATVERYLTEARSVRLADVSPNEAAHLASPMCHEDRYTTYVITRIARPELAIETGIAHGISSAYVLAAMEAGNRGRLISIELDHDPHIGGHVPAGLRSRWNTCWGNSLQLLPDLVALQGPLDLFLHDSDHNYRHVWREFEIVWPHIRPGSLLCAHDVLHNNAFPRFVRKHRASIDAWASSINFGVIRKSGGESHHADR
ncbi:MAG: class I SAM-dependent methyltransferase [Phycisphaerales bacterium]|nr:MAG: class I SAM-dependent methyltransferase [Phycisphaerales bacterium]